MAGNDRRSEVVWDGGLVVAGASTTSRLVLDAARFPRRSAGMTCFSEVWLVARRWLAVCWEGLVDPVQE